MRLRAYIERINREYMQMREELAAAWNAAAEAESKVKEIRADRDLTADGRRRRLEAPEKALADARRRIETLGFTNRDKITELREQADSTVLRQYSAKPEDIDSAALTLLDSGICTEGELYALAEQYSGNATMCRLIGKAMCEKADGGGMDSARRTALHSAGAMLSRPRELEAAAILDAYLVAVSAGLRTDRRLADGAALRVYPAAYQNAIKQADALDGDSGADS